MVGVLLLQACSPKIAVLSADKIPDFVKADIAAGSIKPTSVTWRVCEQMTDYLFVACDLSFEFEQGKKETAYFIGAYKDGQMIHGAVNGLPASLGFSGLTSSSMSAVDGALKYGLEAFGTAYASKIVKVSAVTSQDKTYETSPANGYWLIMTPAGDTKETWAKITALDKDGREVGTVGNAPLNPKTQK
jgi:hypothetical protein